jgi:hypothetical protein
VSVVSAALGALMAGRRSSVLLVDLGGDLPAVLGLPEPDRPGVLDWCASEAPPEALDRLVVEVAPGLQLLGRGDGPPAVEQQRASELAQHLSSIAPVSVVDAGMPLDGAPPDAVAVPDRPTRRALGEHLRPVGSSIFVTRACYLALRRAVRVGVDADGLVVLAEPGRSLDPHDVAAVLGLPLLGVVEADPAVARAIDAGTLARRVPASLRRGLRHAG